jgi:hypothetical protein
MLSTIFYAKIQRINAYAEIAGSMIQDTFPGSNIPSKTVQAFNAGINFFNPKLKKQEKAVNAFQLIISSVELGMSVYLILNDSRYANEALTMFDLMYQGTLLINLIYNEVFLCKS